MTTLRDRFRALHESGTFLLPNPWDVGSARLLESLGFSALATTSSGLAASLGKRDQEVTRDELVAHVAAVTAAVDIPLNVDAERLYAADPSGIAETVELLAAAGASGLSIEDYDPTTNGIDTVRDAAERVAAAAEACARHGIVLTARAENHLYGAGDLDDTIARLKEYQAAGAEVVYAPGLHRPADIARVLTAVSVPVNVLAWPNGPTVPELARLGVRRVSTGGALAWAAYGAARDAALELLGPGTSAFRSRSLTGDENEAAFGPR